MEKKILTIVIFLVFLIFLSLISSAYINISLDEPLSGLRGNTVNDLAYDPDSNIVWIATGRGVTKFEDGDFWSYDKSNGLNENQISALAISDSAVWVAVSYTKLFEGEVIPYGAGFNLTTDSGDNWKSFTPPQASWVGQLAYDLEIKDSTIWAACWYGGLIRSRDEGESWENSFVDSLAKEDYESGSYNLLRNRFFSVVADTSPCKDQMRKNEISDIAWDGRFLWLGTSNGLQVTQDTGKTWFEYDTSFGLNYNSVSALASQYIAIDTATLDTVLWVATQYFEVVNGDTVPYGGGFNRTTDFGYTWESFTPEQTVGSGRIVYDIATIDSTVWAACDSGGLIRSKYDGDSIMWESIFTDSPVRSVFIEKREDSTVVWVGTATSGIYKFIYTNTDTPDTVINCTSDQDGLSGDSVVCVRVQNYQNSDTTKIIWAGTCPTLDGGEYGVSKSTDDGETWTVRLKGERVWDFDFKGKTVYVATSSGVKRSYDYGQTWENLKISDSENDFKPLSPEFYSVNVSDNMVWAGSGEGICSSSDLGETWKIFKFFITYKLALWAGTAAGIFKFIYTDSDSADTVISYSYEGGSGISGDFVVALGVQEYNDKKIVWAGTQPAYAGYYGVSRTTDDGKTWEVLLSGDKAWNFDFDDSVVWVATSSGLKRSYDWGESWDVFDYIIDEQRPDQQILSKEYYAVKVVRDSVWAGNFDGLIRIKKDASVSDFGDVFRAYVSAPPAYAYPSPFSPYLLTGKTRICFDIEDPGAVTVKIYDFAMNLVTTIEQEFDEIRGCEVIWDGRNDKGDVVANGVYFFKIESPGQTQWGKVVVIK